ncbi:response regulator [Pedococcus sp. 5OH_020]|jgi:two-component system KDP operon response regulator KdpE|uniref:response regulator n=1 Tax=Pedococcus sp. 5OH_020 TaxID=2989814 RepID=UPI0022E99A13|nr:response regulator [Pedococcus sp. 5OH_020]
MTRVLVVEDEDRLRRALAINLKARGYDVEAVGDGRSALRAAASTVPDLVVVDLGLPDVDGVEVVQGLRGWTNVPIIILSARDSQWDKVDGLDAGADDYLTKPFGMDELLARVRAALRRSAEATAAVPVVETATLRIDLGAKRVQRDSHDVRLTPTEWHFLEALVRQPGKLVPGRRLLHDIWGPAYEDETNYLRVYMAQLRRKLEVDPSHPRHLITEPGLGYRFEP